MSARVSFPLDGMLACAAITLVGDLEENIEKAGTMHVTCRLLIIPYSKPSMPGGTMRLTREV